MALMWVMALVYISVGNGIGVLGMALICARVQC